MQATCTARILDSAADLGFRQKASVGKVSEMSRLVASGVRQVPVDDGEVECWERVTDDQVRRTGAQLLDDFADRTRTYIAAP
jgi:hypothetical protein